MLIDLHSHTYPRSGCSEIQPDALVAQAKQSGLDGICLTEHCSVWPKELVARLREEHQFLVLRGVEATTNAGHVLVFGLESYVRGLSDVRELRRIVDSIGGVMILAHPLRHQLGLIPEDEYPELFDALEVLNGSESPESNAAITGLACKLGLDGTAGSDAHALREIGSCATLFDGEIRSEEDLIEALKSSAFQPHQLR